MTPERLQEIIFASFSFHALQEVSWLCNILEKFKLKNVLEIGTAFGASLMIWDRLMEPDGFLVGMDIDNRMCAALEELIRKSHKNIKIILGDSQAPEIIEKIKQCFPGRIIDFLFIDGWHSYEAVEQDYLNYGPLVRLGGIIAIHDIMHFDTGVGPFWKDLKAKENLQIEEFKDHNGVGVIHVKE